MKIELENYLPLVKKIAYKYYKKYSYFIEYNDLVNYGVLGLIDAYNKYDPKKAEFTTYAYFRVNGNIIYELQKMNKLKVTFVEDYQQFENHKSKDNIEGLFLNNELSKEVIHTLNGLNEKQRKVIVLKYYQDVPTNKISKEMKVSNSRVHQLAQEAYQIIKKSYHS
jgi:RNA polymerase sigma factor (sigma-70 family)